MSTSRFLHWRLHWHLHWHLHWRLSLFLGARFLSHAAVESCGTVESYGLEWSLLGPMSETEKGYEAS